jgi:hypothetical protein
VIPREGREEAQERIRVHDLDDLESRERRREARDELRLGYSVDLLLPGRRPLELPAQLALHWKGIPLSCPTVSRLFQPSTSNVTACQLNTPTAHRRGACRFRQLPYVTGTGEIIDGFRLNHRPMPYKASRDCGRLGRPG